MNNNYNYSNQQDLMNYDILMNAFGLGNISTNNVGMNVNITNNNSGSSGQLYGPYEGYMKGNMFKNLYQQYKDYQPAKLIPKSEEDEALLNLNQMHFAMHEANLFLDVYPNNANMMKEYVNFRNNYNSLLDSYQKKYGALNVNSDNLSQIPFGWEEEKWPWDRRGL